MKQIKLAPSFVRRILATGAALCMIAATSAADAPKPSVDLVALRQSLGQLQTQVSETSVALEGLMKAARQQASLQPAYQAFDGKLKQLQSNLETLRAGSTKMRARTEDHYKAWRDELSKMGNPKLRDKALNRYEDAKEEFDEIIVIAAEAKRELEPFMADLNDVATYLKADLSADAVKTLSNTIWKIGNKSRALVASIQHVSAQISKALEQLPEGK